MGRQIITGSLKHVGSGAGLAEPKYVAIGTGAGTANRTDTTLFTEGGTRVAGTSSQATTTVTNDTYSVVGTQTAAGALAVTNAGTFDASSAGNIFVKGDFATVNLATGDSIQITASVQFT